MKNWRRWFVGVIIAAALVGAVLHWGELRNFAELLRRAEPRWLIVAVALQLVTYASVALGWRAVLLRAEGKLYALRPLFRIALSKLFADQALPTAGMGGNVLLVDQLVALGVMRGTAVAALLISLLGFYASYLVFAVITLFLLWLHGDATPLMVGLVTSFVLVAIAIPALALWLRRRGSKPLPAVVESVRPIRQLLETVAQAPAELIRDRGLFLRVMLLNALVFAADVLTLYTCLRALGTEVSLSTALIAYILAAIAVTLGPIPLGLGSFEVVCTSTLRLLGVPLEAALAGTLLLRVLILWLPLVPGLVLMRTMLRRRGRRPPE
jgi:uncharacterized protein (TIRG00374 family)